MKTWQLVAASSLALGLAGGALAANDDYNPPNLGTMQVSPKKSHHKKKYKRSDIKLSAPTFDFGLGHASPAPKNDSPSSARVEHAPRGKSGRGPTVSPIEALHVPAPSYPSDAGRASATVKVMFTIQKDGRTGDIRVLTHDAPGAFRRATRAAVADWRFKPKTVNGEPRALRVTQTVHFSPPAQRAPPPANKRQSSPSGRGPDVAHKPPVPAHLVAPKYPRAARGRRATGYVLVAFTVNADGSVSDIDVVNSEPRHLFDKAALKAVRQWRFKPYRVNGKPASVRVKQRIQFSP
jgi:TonB family protein